MGGPRYSFVLGTGLPGRSLPCGISGGGGEPEMDIIGSFLLLLFWHLCGNPSVGGGFYFLKKFHLKIFFLFFCRLFLIWKNKIRKDVRLFFKKNLLFRKEKVWESRVCEFVFVRQDAAAACE